MQEVNLPAACQGKRLEEHAVGPNMAQFRNNAVSIKDFNEFRVLITQPDATGATTFCGVVCHFILLDDFDLTLVLVDDSRDVGVGQVRKGIVQGGVMRGRVRIDTRPRWLPKLYLLIQSVATLVARK
jgi:hypothetical protein